MHTTYWQSGHARNVTHSGTTGIVISVKWSTTICTGRQGTIMDIVVRAAHAVEVKKAKASVAANRVKTF